MFRLHVDAAWSDPGLGEGPDRKRVRLWDCLVSARTAGLRSRRAKSGVARAQADGGGCVLMELHSRTWNLGFIYQLPCHKSFLFFLFFPTI